MNAIACCYAIACALDRDIVQRKRLISDPFLQGLKRPPKEEDLSQWVLLYTFRAKTKGPARDRVTRYAAVLRRYKREGVESSQALAQLVQDGGITKAYQKCQGERRVAGNAKKDVEKAKLRHSVFDAGSAQDEHDGGRDEDSSLKGKKSSCLVQEERCILEIECSKEHLSAVLALSKASLTVKIIPVPKYNDERWKIIRLLCFEDQP